MQVCFHASNYVAADDEWKLYDTDPFPGDRIMVIVGQLRSDTHCHITVDKTLECMGVFGRLITVETKPCVYVIYMDDCP